MIELNQYEAHLIFSAMKERVHRHGAYSEDGPADSMLRTMASIADRLEAEYGPFIAFA